jgi:hypothetical protein
MQYECAIAVPGSSVQEWLNLEEILLNHARTLSVSKHIDAVVARIGVPDY